jgi:phage terminase large subunit
VTWRDKALEWALVVVIALIVLVGLMSTLAEAQATVARWRELPNGPVQFAHEQLHFDPDPWQRDVLTAFGDPRQQRISLQACAGPGKTAIEAVCGWYFLATQCTPGEHPKGICTSVTKENLRDNLWAEFAKWRDRSSFLKGAFTWTSSRIFANDHPETWFLTPRAWPKGGTPAEQGATLSGLHSRNVLFLVDESGNIPTTVGRTAEQALGNTAFGKLLQGGNPISLEGMLYEAATKLRHLYTIIPVTGDPDDPNAWVFSPRVLANVAPGSQSPADWAREQIRTYGRENPWVKSYILGQFPPQSLNALLGVEEVERAMSLELTPAEYEWAQRRLGVDVARFGDDRSVLFPRQGKRAFKPVVMRTALTTDIAARIAHSLERWPAEAIFVDDTGHWGHGVIDNLLSAQASGTDVDGAGRALVAAAISGVVFHGKAIDPHYRNRRAEMWIEMAKWVKAGGKLPNYPELVAELTTPTFTFVNGTLALEEKDQIKKRLGRSPDLADGLALTFAIPDMPHAEVLEQLHGIGAAQRVVSDIDRRVYANQEPAGSGHVAHDYDPYGGNS